MNVIGMMIAGLAGILFILVLIALVFGVLFTIFVGLLHLFSPSSIPILEERVDRWIYTKVKKEG